MAKPKIYFDMDGTLVDFYNYPGWLGYIRSYNTVPYRRANPIGDENYISSVFAFMKRCGYTFSVISWCSKESDEDFTRRTIDSKKYWLRKHYPKVFTNNIFTDYGVPKNSLVNAEGAFLFDDNKEVGELWEANGGIWIDVTKFSVPEMLLKIQAGEI